MPSIFILEDWTFIRREWLDIYPLHLGKSHIFNEIITNHGNT